MCSKKTVAGDKKGCAAKKLWLGIRKGVQQKTVAGDKKGCAAKKLRLEKKNFAVKKCGWG